MSSDSEEEVLTGRQKRSASLAKRGRNRVSTLADDDDDGVFDDAGVDGSDDEIQRYKEVDVTFSTSNLKKALQQLKAKGCMNPEPDGDLEAKTWKDMEREIREKNINLQELETLVKYLNFASDNISLEYKCLVISIARQTCITAKSKEETKKAQELFKSKDKSNKTNHVANFVSNTWFWESMGQLQKLGAISTTTVKNNMHIALVECSLQFMRDSYVIDTEKKLNVLKEKQQIDWAKSVLRASKLASANKITSMAAEAGLTKNHFQAMKDGKKPAGATPGSKDAAASTTSVEASSLQDLARKKRTERLQNLRRRVSATSLQAIPSAGSTASATSQRDAAKTTPSALSTISEAPKAAPAPAPTPSATSHSRNDRAPTGSRSTPSVGTSQPAASKSTWGRPRNEVQSSRVESATPTHAPSRSAPAPAPEASNPSSTYRDSSRQRQKWGSAPAPPPSAPPPSASGSSWNDSSGSGQSSSHPPSWDRGDSSRPQTSEPQPRSKWEGSSGGPAHDREDYPNSHSRSQGYGQHRDMERSYAHDPYPSSSGRPDRAQTNSTSVVGDSDSAEARGRTWGNSAPNSAAYSAGSAYDNQTDGSGGYDQSRGYAGSESRSYSSGGGGGDYPSNSRDGGYNQDSYGKRSRDHDMDRQPERNGDKRQRYDQPPAHSDPNAAMGRGRGRGRTLPAWMTQNGADGPTSDGPPPPSMPSHHQSSSDYSSREQLRDPQPQRNFPPQREPPVALQGNGRGRGRTLPAWMTQPGADGPQGQAAGPPPPSQRNPPPESSVRNPPPQEMGGFREPSRDAPVTLQGTGRGRGRTLPAWMTQQK